MRNDIADLVAELAELVRARPQSCPECLREWDGQRTTWGECRHCGCKCGERLLCLECQATGICPVCGKLPE
jgi:hypothetical protein